MSLPRKKTGVLRSCLAKNARRCRHSRSKTAPAATATPTDSAVLDLQLDEGSRLAFTTDSYVVRPLFFPGGDIGSLAIHGTVNDLLMCGARPRALALAFILEEGLEMARLWRIVKPRAIHGPTVEGYIKMLEQIGRSADEVAEQRRRHERYMDQAVAMIHRNQKVQSKEVRF